MSTPTIEPGAGTSTVKNARVAGLLYILASAVGVVRLMYIPAK